MRVEKSGKKKTARSGAPPASSRGGVASVAKSPFIQRFHVAQRDAIREELNALMVQIDAQAKEVERSLTFDRVDRYRELVQKFVGIAVNELFEVEEKISVSATGRQKALVTVKKINETLEDLTNNFLDRQKNLIQFIATLDRIRGMLLDLYG